jgi:protein-S-isoprenylcysteine O-methyltransferase Ste14
MIRESWAAFRRTKVYDLLAALPLMLWYLGVLWRLIPYLRQGPVVFAQGMLVNELQYLSVAGSAVFYLVIVLALVSRSVPVARSEGFAPRAVAMIGTFMSVAILYLPPATLSRWLQVLANGMLFAGCIAAALIVRALGRNFSVFPEVRGLVTRGPYAWARHPLYTAESLIVIGTAIQFAQPWAGVLGAVNLAFIFARTVYEEHVLERAYPEYATYRLRTARFIPGVF